MPVTIRKLTKGNAVMRLVTVKKLAFSASLFPSTLALSAQSQEIRDNFKGTGEVVVASAGEIFEAAQRKPFFDPFMRDTGIKVMVVASDNAKLLASVRIGQSAGGITNSDAGELANWLRDSALEKIDYSYFSKETLAGIPEELRGAYGIGSFFYGVVVAYNIAKYPEGGKHPRNWVDFYNVDDFMGKRTLPNCDNLLIGGLVEGALLGDGVPPEKLYPLGLDRAFAKRAKIRPDVARSWATGADAPQSFNKPRSGFGSCLEWSDHQCEEGRSGNGAFLGSVFAVSWQLAGSKELAQ
ncbi:spermidine/putrescine-binding protein [Bradyrhizobium sp. LA6.10]